MSNLDRRTLIDLCNRGLLTCTRGKPGDSTATYALGWIPLDRPDDFPPEVRDRHARNMKQFPQRENLR
jgi:hypothetical protein